MSDYKDADFKERLSAAAQAKRAMLERFRTKADDPAARGARGRAAGSREAREKRHAERKAAREAEAAQKKADAARHAARQREAREKAEKEAREIALEAERKAARATRAMRHERSGSNGRGWDDRQSGWSIAPGGSQFLTYFIIRFGPTSAP